MLLKIKFVDRNGRCWRLLLVVVVVVFRYNLLTVNFLNCERLEADSSRYVSGRNSMSRGEELHLRDRLMMLAEGPRKPFNVKRKQISLTKLPSRGSTKLSVQDFVRMDPGYTPDIEHLVFPGRRKSPRQVAPVNPPPGGQQQGGKTRSRLAEMFALSRHLQQRSADRDQGKGSVNRSVDSVLDCRPSGSNAVGPRLAESGAKRWAASVEEPVQARTTTTRLSPAGDAESMATARGPNVSVVHLRSADPWESSKSGSAFTATVSSNRSHSVGRGVPPLTKHQSIGGYRWGSNSLGFGDEGNGIEGCNRELSPVRWCDREVDGVYLGRSGWVQVQHKSLDDRRGPSYPLAVSALQSSRRTGMKLAEYHCNSEPASRLDPSSGSRQSQDTRPAYLSLPGREFEQRKSQTPSPRHVVPDSPPSVTPIISPPPAFQDRNKNSAHQTRTFFGGKPPFLPRSNAIEDSDASPPLSPVLKWKSPGKASSQQPSQQDYRYQKTSPQQDPPTQRLYPRIPQTKSMEDTTMALRRTQFLQKRGESSSSSSSSLGFRSLDSCVSRPAMPRLSENTDSSIDVYEDADEEDNNSSSIVSSIVAPLDISTRSRPAEKTSMNGRREALSEKGRSVDKTPAKSAEKMPARSVEKSSASRSLEKASSKSVEKGLINEKPSGERKLSPSGRSGKGRRDRRVSPGGSDRDKASANCSSSSTSSSLERPTKSPSGTAQPARRPYHPRSPHQEDTPSLQRVRRSRSLQLPDRRSQPPQRVSPQHPQPGHRVVVKVGGKDDPRVARRHTPLEDDLDEETRREAEVVAGWLYGSRSRAAAQALLKHNRYNNSTDEKPKDLSKHPNNGLTVYIVGNSKNDRQKILHRGATAPNLSSQPKHAIHVPQPELNKKQCTASNCDYWSHCQSNPRESQPMMKVSQSYPTHQRSLEATNLSIDRSGGQDPYRKRSPHDQQNPPPAQYPRAPHQYQNGSPEYRRQEYAKGMENRRRLSPSQRDTSSDNVCERKTSPGSRSANRLTVGTMSSSSSSSDMWVTTSDRTVTKSPRNVKSSGTSTPMEEMPAECGIRGEVIMTRPGSAPTEERNAELLEAQQRSMSLPKSFLSVSYQQGGQFPWKRRGTESMGSSPGCQRKALSPETSHTAPVTPLHEGGRRRSPLGGVVRKTKANSTPQLLENPLPDSRKWSDEKIDGCEEVTLNPAGVKEFNSRRTISGNVSESVLQKFRKTFSLRFQRKGSKESGSTEIGETLCEILGDPSEEDSPQRVPSGASSSTQIDIKDEHTEQKPKFGSLIWRSSKERKKMNKATRSMKCNSGDSGIQIEMVPSGCGGAGDSSESHDTDAVCDDLLDSPPAIRRRPPHSAGGGIKANRPHSDLLNQILIDKFKADLKQRAHRHQVRRTRSDLGGQRLLQWDPRRSYRRLMSSPGHPRNGRPASPRRRADGTTAQIQLRPGIRHGGALLRRSLSQPLDIDKLSPLMRAKTAGLRPGGSNVLSEDEHDSRLCGTSDEDAMSDSESSVTSLSERKKSLELAMDEEMVILAEAVFDHVAIEAEELAFRAGDVIEVLETANRDWWWGATGGLSGWFPAHFVRLRVSQEDTVEDCLEAMASGRSVSAQVRRRTSVSLLSNDQVRTSVVRELVNTERDFVKVLQDVAEGYVAECRKRTDMFTEKQISTIFMNLEEMLKFQSAFLKDLEGCIDWDEPYKSCVGECFLKYINGFKMYSDYCNSHPMATATLQELYQYNNYSKFFEACRLMRGLIEIPLDGYLLTPVQRICKYPLQLAELLKYTKVEHPDYQNIKQALEAMRNVAVLINERKRRMESLEKLAAWQLRVEGWESDDLIEGSSQLIHQGEVVRVTSGMWTNNITLFLFDHQLIYCKKDILKRNTYVYKGRICLDTSEVIDVADGKDGHLGVSVRHAIKLYSQARDKWLLFCCRSSSDKQKWLDAFSKERKLVAQDKDDGLEFPPAAKQLARLAARRQRRPPRKPRSSKNYNKHDSSAYMGSNLQLNANTHNSNSLGRKVGTWFTFGANKKTRHQHRELS